MLCLKVIPVNTQIGVSGASGAVTSVSLAGVSSVGSTCAAGEYAAFTQAEVSDYFVSPFKLSMQEGAAISTAVLGIWAIGFGVRMVIRVLRDVSHTTDVSD